jgi:D-alanine-D-alanine ligase
MKDLKQCLIVVLSGGPGNERQVSLASGQAVAKALAAAGCRVAEVDVRDGSFALPAGTGLAFNLVHGTFGEDGALQQELEARGVPYTGAGIASSRLAFDKLLSKQRFLAAGVPTPLAETLDLTNSAAVPSLPLPCVIKPPREGSSVGVHIVREPSQLAPALADVARHGPEGLVEQFVVGKELTVGVLEDRALPVVHIAPRSGFYDMANKYPWLGGGGSGSDYHCPADLDPATTARVQQAAVAAHRALGIEVYSRVDVLLDESGSPFVLEANTIPGMTETSLLPKAAAAAGIVFTELCLRIARVSLELRG